MTHEMRGLAAHFFWAITPYDKELHLDAMKVA
jgi:hypothetical protein